MEQTATADPVLKPGQNCWRREYAEQVAYLIDGEAYYRAVREAIAKAKHSVLILGWDIDSRMTLLREEPDDGHPARLGDFLNSVVSHRKELQVHILIWDFAMIYSMEREWMPIYKLGWKTHRRLHFFMDDKHPVGASQHQKVIVVDDRVAFVGGFDLSKWRWDSSQHAAGDPRRTDPEGEPYPPFHDIAMAVSGPVAAKLGDLSRKRWLDATGESLEPVHDADASPWPDTAQATQRDTDVAIARTEPMFGERPEAREIEQLYLDAITSANRWIYIENQYFTSQKLHEALSERLGEEEGPEIVLVLPLKTGGWLEQHTMDVLRDRLLRQLQEADRHNRLRVYYASIPGTQSQFVQIHSKLMVVDDRLLTIGSANLSNRSMGLDSECNLALESDEPEQQQTIAQFRHRLLAEHLDTSQDDITATMDEVQSLIATIERHSDQTRTLKPLKPLTPPEVDELVPEQPLLDPERPIEPDRMVDIVLGEEQQQPAGGHLLGAGLLLGSLLLLAILWRWTPLGAWLTPDRLQGMFEGLSALPVAPIIITGAIVLASLVAVPLTLLVVMAILTFGPVEGLIYSHIGATLSALLAFSAGQYMGKQTIRRFGGKQLNRLSRRLGKRGILSVIFLRIVPVAPFSLINLVAGASHIRFRDFLLGTIVGLLPGMLALTAFVDGLLRTLQRPGWRTAIWLLAVIAIISLGGYLIRKGLLRQKSKQQD